MAPATIERASRAAYEFPSLSIVSMSVASATEGAAPNKPAKLFGRKTSPTIAKSDTMSPPNKNRSKSGMAHYRIRAFGSCRRTPIGEGRPVCKARAMAARSKRTPGLSDPTLLKSFDSDEAELITVIIETPKGSRNKYAFDTEERIFALKKVLPAGMEFPYDFGFVPSTRGGDGDPLDVLVLMDEPAFPGCKLSCRIIGIIEGEQGTKKQCERNDRVVAVESDNHSYAHVRRLADLGKQFERELEGFFVNYHRLSGEKYRILSVKGPAAARRCVKQARRRLR
jgi:inorganic pyrophosphatase